MATMVLANTLQYSFLDKPSSREATDTGSQSWTWLKSLCMYRHKTFFLSVAALPQWRLSMNMAQLLGLQGPWQCKVFRDMVCLHRRSYGPIRVLFWASCSWWSEGLFGQSFSIALPIQALRWLPCLGSFNITVIQVYAPTTNAEKAEVERIYEDLQDLQEQTPKKDVLFIIGNWNAKVESHAIPGVTGKFGLVV